MPSDPSPNQALLPAGLRDLLPPEAEAEAWATAVLMETFSAHGYQRVKPPLLEFEDTLLAGTGAAVADHTFRLMDPDTHRMVALRADITPQIARIATTRLGHAPRPLRLCYAGQTLRTRAGNLSPDRQVGQAGIELIGADSSPADAETVAVAAEALAALGLTRVSIDLTAPPLVQALLDDHGIAGEDRRALAHALDRKDAAAVAAHGGAHARTLTALLLAAGPAAGALAALAQADLTPAARAHADRLADTVAAIHAQAPGLKLTVDPVEFRGYRYHTGVCSTIYAPGRHEELGRGGRYVCGEGEPATGLTLFPDAVLRSVTPPGARRRVYVPFGTAPEHAASIRKRGFATVAALDPADEPLAAARRLGCAHVARGGEPVALADMEQVPWPTSP
jgi:ATP phosphoribosyltransferase regulatory subunit